MVPSHFNPHNVSKLLKLLKISLSRAGRLLYFVGSPIYFSIYRVFLFLNKTSKKLQKSVKINSKRYVIKKIGPLISTKTRLLFSNVHDTATIRLRSLRKTAQKMHQMLHKRSKHLIYLIKKSLTDQDINKKHFKRYLTNHQKIAGAGLLVLQKKSGQILLNTKRRIDDVKHILIPYLKKQKSSVKKGLFELQSVYQEGKRSFRKKWKTVLFNGHKQARLLSGRLARSKKLFYTKVKYIKSKRVRWAVYALSIILLAVITTGLAMWFAILDDLPSAEVLAAREVKASTKIYDRNGLLLYKIYKDENRTPVSLYDVPEHVKNATLAIEDSDFYSHPGFSIRGMARAVIRNYQRGELTGGSTITQQLVKNTLLTPEKTLTRKIKEIVLAVEVEMNYSKDEILEMYLNEVSYGGTAYGIQEAATMYFNKSAQDLTLAEAALLAGLPKSPTDYSPFGAEPQRSVQRRVEVLRLMEENGFITAEQRRQAQKERLVFSTDKIDIKAPHFVMFVRELLEDKYGKEMVEQGGLEVHTTLDYETQLAAEQVVREEVENLSRLKVGNGAAVVISPSSGEVLAMVGSKDYFDYANDGNVNVTTSLRQPGSSIKIVNYAYALSNSYTPASIIDDSPATFLIKGSPPYKPKNYDGRYRGRISLRSAFAESRNVPAVKVLNSYGVGNMIDLGKRMGITTWEERDRFGLSLTLGGGEVKLIDLAQAYSAVANYGRRPKLTPVLKVTDYKGNILESNECESQERSTLLALADKLSTEVYASESAIKLPFQDTSCQGEKVLDPRVAYILTDILKDNNARTPAFGRNSLLNIAGHPEVAVKTGTSNDLRDNLTIGYNQNYLVAVWVGNNDNTPMSRVASGITGASPIFNKLMTYLLHDKPSNEWVIPNGLVKLDICPYTGTLACSGCPTVSEWFLEENRPDRRCSQEWFEQKDEEGDEESHEEVNRSNVIPGWIRRRLEQR